MEWQSSQRFEVGGWSFGFPVACDPLWQRLQFPTTPEWSKLALRQLMVLWQVPHSFEDGTCLEPLPVEMMPLWQEMQFAFTLPWSKRAVRHDDVV